MKQKTTIYDLNGRPPLKQAISVGLQHVISLMVGNVTPIILVGAALGFGSTESSFLVQCAIFVAGIVTLFQLNSIGFVGSKLPIIMGTSSTYIAISISVGAKYGMQGILGAVLVAAIFQIILGFYITRIKQFFPSLVTGCIVLCLGLMLFPIGIDYFAGGAGSAGYGSINNLIVATFTLLLIVFFQVFTKGLANISSILLGIIGGYLLAIPLGLVNFEAVSTAPWFALPKPWQYGVSFHFEAILPMVIIAIVTSVQSIGNIAATTSATLGREATGRELRGGLLTEGFGSIFSALFNALPTTTYAQNVGIVIMTKAINRFSLLLCAGIMIVCGFMPKLSAFFIAMPASVLGGAAILLFATVAVNGMKMISTENGFDNRAILITALSVGLGIGLYWRPEIMAAYPGWLAILLVSGLPVTAVLAFVLNILIRKK